MVKRGRNSPVVQWSSIGGSGPSDPGSNPGRAISKPFYSFLMFVLYGDGFDFDDCLHSDCWYLGSY